jgi:hypothetical protein
MVRGNPRAERFPLTRWQTNVGHEPGKDRVAPILPGHVARGRKLACKSRNQQVRGSKPRGDSYACRRGKRTLAPNNRLMEFLRRGAANGRRRKPRQLLDPQLDAAVLGAALRRLIGRHGMRLAEPAGANVGRVEAVLHQVLAHRVRPAL